MMVGILLEQRHIIFLIQDSELSEFEGSHVQRNCARKSGRDLHNKGTLRCSPLFIVELSMTVGL